MITEYKFEDVRAIVPNAEEILKTFNAEQKNLLYSIMSIVLNGEIKEISEENNVKTFHFEKLAKNVPHAKELYNGLNDDQKKLLYAIVGAIMKGGEVYAESQEAV